MNTLTTTQQGANHHSDVYMAQNFINSDTPLTPKMISSLMHVGVRLNAEHEHHAEDVEEDSVKIVYVGMVIVASVVAAVLVGTIFLFVNEIGPFYKPELGAF